MLSLLYLLLHGRFLRNFGCLICLLWIPLCRTDTLALVGDGTPVYTSAQDRKTHTCNCLEKGIHDRNCSRIYHQPDCDIGWDSHRNRFYFGYDLYILTASDTENDLPVFPFLSSTSRHDSHGFFYKWFSMKQMLPDAVNYRKEHPDLT